MSIKRLLIMLLAPVIAGCLVSAQPTVERTPVQRITFLPAQVIEENRIFADANAATAIRADLGRFIFGMPVDQLRTAPPRETRLNAHPLAPTDLAASVAQFDFPLAGDWSARALLIEPRRRTRGIVLFHQGHLQGGRWEAHETDHDRHVIAALLERGHAVMFMSMPLTWENPRPTLRHPRHGEISIETHEQLRLFEQELGFNPLRLFLEPVRGALQELRLRYPEQNICLLGLSGGGWTVEMYAAVDPSVGCTVSVAGSLPLSLRKRPSVQLSWGDYEQTHPGILSRVTYLEIYTLAALEAGRVFSKFLIKDDPCCYAVEAEPTFDEDVSLFLAQRGGGTMSASMDDRVTLHAISPMAIDEVSQLLLSTR
jgi:hypothetical protein